MAQDALHRDFTPDVVSGAIEKAGVESESAGHAKGDLRFNVTYESGETATLSGRQCHDSEARCDFLMLSAKMPAGDKVTEEWKQRTVALFNQRVPTATAIITARDGIVVRRLLSSGGGVTIAHIAYEIDMFAKSLVPMRSRLDQIQRDMSR